MPIICKVSFTNTVFPDRAHTLLVTEDCNNILHYSCNNGYRTKEIRHLYLSIPLPDVSLDYKTSDELIDAIKTSIESANFKVSNIIVY